MTKQTKSGPDCSPWHPGERMIQARAGVADKMEGVGRKVIRDFMPAQHRELFSKLPMLIVGGEDARRNIWASALFGSPGFINPEGPHALTVHAPLSPFDPLAGALDAGRDVGLLGIELETRRRNRLNGVITHCSANGFTVAVKQSFGNCPKYVQTRERTANTEHGVFESHDFTEFDDKPLEILAGSDTFFIASVFNDDREERNRGVDVSHRGGLPGFVRVEGRRMLLIPDYAGNNFFNTLGNLARDDRVGLLFPDFSHGHLMHLTGNADVIHAADTPLPFNGVERMIRFRLAGGRLTENAVPYRWTLLEISQFCLRYGQAVTASSAAPPAATRARPR